MMSKSLFSEADAGRLIRDARRGRKLTQIELAEHANVSRGVIQKLEEGRGQVNLQSLIKVANILGLDLRLVDRRDG